MIVLFAPLLVAIGAAYAFRRRSVRALLVIGSALMTELATSIAYERWGWAAFVVAMLALDAIGIALVKSE